MSDRLSVKEVLTDMFWFFVGILASAGILMLVVSDNENLQWGYNDCFSVVIGIAATVYILAGLEDAKANRRKKRVDKSRENVLD